MSNSNQQIKEGRNTTIAVLVIIALAVAIAAILT